jgi:DNA-binding response OmpR family regulator
MARILVIDDEAALRDTMRRALEKAGHEVVVAEDGKVGLALYRDKPADLVITDIFMPGQDGFEIIRELRAEGVVKVIAVSGGDRTGRLNLREHAQSLGARRTLAKPFELKALLGTVDEVLREP